MLPRLRSIGPMQNRPPAHFRIDGSRSSVRVGSRSTMGPITFESRAISGDIRFGMTDGWIDPSATLDVGLQELRSGNDLYDAELHRRIDVTRFPTCHLELRHSQLLGGTRFVLTGDMTFHGITRELQGSAEVESPDEQRLLIVGEKTVDIRDFDLPAPTVMLLKIYPDVRVQMFLEATMATGAQES